MNKHLLQRVTDLLNRHSDATLATCGLVEPQISIVTYTFERLRLYVAMPHGSDHLFNLEMQPNLVLLTENWRLHGQARLPVQVNYNQATVIVTMKRLHILNGQHSVETIDF
jgi:hypothetical protein